MHFQISTATITYDDFMSSDRVFRCGAAGLYRNVQDLLIELSCAAIGKTKALTQDTGYKRKTPRQIFFVLGSRCKVLSRKRWRMIKDALDQTYSADEGAVSSFASVKRPPLPAALGLPRAITGELFPGFRTEV